MLLARFSHAAVHDPTTCLLAEPQDAQIADEVGALLHAQLVAREHVHALSSGWGTAALRTNAGAALSRRSAYHSRQMDEVLFGGSKLVSASSVEAKMLHLKYLCRVINNLQQLASGFEQICTDNFSPLVTDRASTSGIFEADSKQELRKQWGDAWVFDDEYAVLHGMKNG